jgi:hypothetical protein
MTFVVVEGVQVPISCGNCAHKRPGLSCGAFPDGIPSEILGGVFGHTAPYRGDGGLRFAPSEAAIERFRDYGWLDPGPQG